MLGKSYQSGFTDFLRVVQEIFLFLFTKKGGLLTKA